LSNLVVLIPCWRQTSSVAFPASCSRSTRMICSSPNRLLRMSVSPVDGRHLQARERKGAGSNLSSRLLLIAVPILPASQASHRHCAEAARDQFAITCRRTPPRTAVTRAGESGHSSAPFRTALSTSQLPHMYCSITTA
jgi:hypothetical protein